MTFESCITAFSARFLSQRTNDLIVAPALADLEFEVASRRGSISSGRAAVLLAVAGGFCRDARGSSTIFLKLTLLSVSYFTFPVFLAMRHFESWSDFLAYSAVMTGLALVPVIICFWPERPATRSGH